MESGSFIDTHVMIWLISGEIDRISPKAISLIEEKTVLISPISLMEIDYLHEIGRFIWSSNEFLNDFSKKISYIIPDTSFLKIIQQSAKIGWTRDVFDRLLVAHAHILHSALITKDKKIREHYKKAIW